MNLKKYLKLIRIKHWIKNGLIFLPLFFSGKFTELDNFTNTILAFLSFSLGASMVYIINDINDIENDRKHPTKCKRPLASGEIKVKKAYLILIIFAIATIAFNGLISIDKITTWLLLLTYLGSNIIYSLGAKNIALLDITILVLGYIIRIYYGATVINVTVSNWLYLTVLFMAFFLGLGKRRNEIEKTGTKSRKVLTVYTKEFLDKTMYMCLGLTIMSYSLWCEEISKLQGKVSFMFTIPLVVIICMKYSLDIEKDSDGDPTETLFHDGILIGLVTLYAIVTLILIYVI